MQVAANALVELALYEVRRYCAEWQLAEPGGGLSIEGLGHKVLEARRVLQRVDDGEVLRAHLLAVLRRLIVVLELLLEAVPGRHSGLTEIPVRAAPRGALKEL